VVSLSAAANYWYYYLPPIIGRDDDVRQLSKLISSQERRPTNVVTVLGAPNIGKDAVDVVSKVCSHSWYLLSHLNFTAGLMCPIHSMSGSCLRAYFLSCIQSHLIIPHVQVSWGTTAALSSLTVCSARKTARSWKGPGPGWYTIVQKVASLSLLPKKVWPHRVLGLV
jgi:hypothetical protein